MIQFNMLPDVKLEYVRAQRIKHTIMSAAFIASGSAFAIFLMLFLAVHVVQKNIMDGLNKDIRNYSNQLKGTPDIDKILTIQSQLGALPKLHADKVAASRTFRYIQQVVPSNLTLTNVEVDYVQNTISISGEATGFDLVNKLTDTLKLATYRIDDKDSGKAFSEVVMSQFTRSEQSATFVVTAKYQPDLFNNTENVALNVPNTISTPSVSSQPTFQKTTTTTPATTKPVKQ